MKTNKIQKELFTKLLNREDIWSYKISDSETAFTDGIKAFVLEDSCICFDANKAKKNDKLKDVFARSKSEKELVVTRDIKIGACGDKGMARRLITKSGECFKNGKESPGEVWINNKFLDYFDAPRLYASGNSSPVLVFDGAGNDKLSAVICPMRVGGGV